MLKIIIISTYHQKGLLWVVLKRPKKYILIFSWKETSIWIKTLNFWLNWWLGKVKY